MCLHCPEATQKGLRIPHRVEMETWGQLLMGAPTAPAWHIDARVSWMSGEAVTNPYEQEFLKYNKILCWNVIQPFKVTQGSQIVPVAAIPFRNGSNRKIRLWLQPEACCENTTSFWSARRDTSVLTLRLGWMLAPLGPLRVLRWRLRVIGYQHLGLGPWDGV